MTKQEQFLYAVQTVILTNSVNLASVPDRAEKYRHVLSASGVLGTMHDVLYAVERIPDDLSAADAAHEFCAFTLCNLREEQEEEMQVPYWFAR